MNLAAGTVLKSADRDLTLLSRIEDAGLNASAPPQQRWVDGWLVRFCPGKAKRARCINAVAMGRLSLAEKLALCRAIYHETGLQMLVRITPFSQPAGLDAQLATLGMRREDDTRVMVRPVGLPSSPRLPLGLRLDRLGHHAFAELIGSLRGSSLAQRQAHAARLEQSPVPFHGFALVGDSGVAMACGQVALEGGIVGLYDIFTAADHRRRGFAALLCSQLLRYALQHAAPVSYLQVEADNHAARRVYHRLGFADAFAYHYRTPAVDSEIDALD